MYAYDNVIHIDNNSGVEKRQKSDLTIVCTQIHDGLGYSFIVLGRNGLHEDAGSTKESIEKGQIERFSNRFREAMTPLIKSYQPEQLPSILLKIEGFGEELWDLLIPPPLQFLLRGLPEESIIDISTKEMWIPWEILFDGASFLGEKHILRRLPKLPVCTDVTQARQRCHRLSSGEVKRAINVIGDRLNVNEQELAARVFDGVELTVVTLSPTPIATLKEEINETDILHFSCHGIIDGTEQYLRLGPREEHFLSVSSVRRLSMQGGLVFANACASAGSSTLLSPVDFGWHFYAAGAEIFIGSLAPIPSKQALRFANEFYKTWNLGEKSCSAALQAVKKSYSDDSASLFWLFYCIYGQD